MPFPNIHRVLWCTCSLYLLCFVGLPQSRAQPQVLPSDTIALTDMSAFASQAGNWQLAGGVYADRAKHLYLEAEPGTGILVNLPAKDQKSDLYTTWNHGDIELDLEFMMPKDSNSGLYLQGRYEIQLLDSWGVKHPSAGDCGGIYERWDDSKPDGWKGYEGYAPRMNVSRAPGLWQHLNILFEAPRFDADGHKVQNARFVRVVHNGVVIHENVSLTGPTRGAAFNEEAAEGPLRIQGDHGPVAFRNITYKTYAPEPARLTDLKYVYLEGKFEAMPDFESRLPVRAGTSDGLLWEIGGKDNEFAIQYTGTLHVPGTGAHLFTLDLDWVQGDPHFKDKVIGGAEILIGSQRALLHPAKQRRATGTLELTGGTHPFTLRYFKNRAWSRHSMALYVEGPGLKRIILNAAEAQPAPPSSGALAVQPTAEPIAQRGFIMHQGIKKTHVILVGDPSGVHYSYDLNAGAMLHVWKGDFIEVSDMWRSRGQEQLAMPLGSMIPLSGAPVLADLPDLKGSWPAAAVQFQGYTLDAEGYPSFKYALAETAVLDQLRPAQGGQGLVRTITLQQGGQRGLWMRLAEGESIDLLPDGTYSIDDAQYYITTDLGKPILRDVDGGQELLLPIRGGDQPETVSYTMIW